MPYHAVLFDFDGVLGQTMEDNYLAWQHAFGELGIPLSRETYFPLEGISVRDVAVTILNQHQRDLEAVEAVCRSKENHYRQHNRFAFYPGAIELVAKLSQDGVPLGLVSGANHARLQQTVPASFLGQFQVVITGDQVSRAKPDPQPYLLAASRLGVAPANCLVVENAPLGIQAAKAAGMTCLAVQSTLAAAFLTGADLIFDNLAAVDQHVHTLLALPAPALTADGP